MAVFATPVWADKLILTDGREFEGVVTVEEDAVLIVMDYARLRFSKDKILRIEFKDLPRVELSKRLAAASGRGPDALLSVAQWAAKAGLQSEAENILADVLKMSPDHEAARAELGHVRIDGTWHPLDKAIELARSKMEARQFELLLTDILPRLEKVAAARGALPAVLDIVAYTQLRAKKFTAAAGTFAMLAETAVGDAALRYSAIAAILKENADGMYVLREPYPPESRLVGKPVLQAGPASLADPLVLASALRDEARKSIHAGQVLMAAGQQVESSNPGLAHAKYVQASRLFEAADALVEDIARSYRVEIIRRRIVLVRKACDEEARQFDAIVQTLGAKPVGQQAYRQKIADMIRRVENIRSPLREILALARPYPRELFLEVQWAESDLKRLKAIRDVLTETLNGMG